MSANAFDPAIIQDFLTESGELLEQLDQDLVLLEESPTDPEMLNQVFRALHTIKGSASFLALTNLVELAHAAENALNAARNSVVVIDKPAMDLLLEAVDTLRRQFENLTAGEDLVKADDQLVAGLTRLGDGYQNAQSQPAGDTPAQSTPAQNTPADARGTVQTTPATTSAPSPPDQLERAPLELPASKQDLLSFFVEDLTETLASVAVTINALAADPSDQAQLDAFDELLVTLVRGGEFFDCPPLTRLLDCLRSAQTGLRSSADAAAQILPRARATLAMLQEQAQAMGNNELICYPIDGLKAQLDTLAAGGTLSDEQQLPEDASVEQVLAATGAEHNPNAGTGPGSAPAERPLNLPENKEALLDFLVTDLETVLKHARDASVLLPDESRRAEAAEQLEESAQSIDKNADFFELTQMQRIAGAMMRVASHAGDLDQNAATGLVEPFTLLLNILDEQSASLRRRVLLEHEIDPVLALIEQILTGDAAPDRDNPDAPAHPGTTVTPEPADTSAPTAPTAPAGTSANQSKPAPADKNKPSPARPAPMEQTIRVEVSRLESLLNLVGELVLQKNRLSAISRNANQEGTGDQDFRETFGNATAQLDRVTSDLQVAVMRTRMQPLDKLFGKYPRLIRDLAGKTGKNIRLAIEGGDTEVDKSVIEELGDPLVHLMRNSADHGLETPEQRREAGKDPTGVITLAASHEGSFVQIQIKDDGRGLSRQKLGKLAVERGVVTQDQLESMPDKEVYKLIFAPGFSTADQVTDLSGRGVGMDVVRTNIEKIKGTIDLDSVEGQGTTITIRIPLTVAIMNAMMVGIGPETYAIPLASILEIVKPDPATLKSIRSNPVMRLRDRVLPLLDGADVFDLPEGSREPNPFSVVVTLNDKSVGLLVSRLIGQQEIVIKPLDGVVEQTGPVSGATVRDDGGVSLIVDVTKMIDMAERQQLSEDFQNTPNSNGSEQPMIAR